jgi:hypothetical protein
MRKIQDGFLIAHEKHLPGEVDWVFSDPVKSSWMFGSVVAIAF